MSIDLWDDLEVLRVVDEAEHRGDAKRALLLIEEHLRNWDSSGRSEEFWRPLRILHLMQIVLLGTLLPRWAVSRWILEQAGRWLDPRARDRMLRALEVTRHTRAGLPTRWAADEVDAECKVMDHDWVYRQVHLYELGGLDQFLALGASADLMAAADQIGAWASASMGGYRLIDTTTLTITWRDLATGRDIETNNLGAAALVESGECVIGRLVPIESGQMFESTPLRVPEDVAEQVATEPADWVAHLAAACCEPQQEGHEIRTDVGHDFGLLTDLPETLVVWRGLDVLDGRRDIDQDDTDVLLGESVLAVLDGALDDPDDPQTIETWPALSAVLLRPTVITALIDGLQPSDLPALARLGDRLPAPADEVCRHLVDGVRAAG